MSWPAVPLGEVATLARDSIAPERIRGGQLYVGLENIKKGGEFEGVVSVSNGELASSKFAFSSKHVLFGKLRPYLAKIALPDFEGICSTDIMPILPGDRLDRRYLAHYLLTPNMVALASDRATGANLPRLSPKVLMGFPVPLPPIDEQRRIATILDKAEELRAKRRAALALLDQLPQAIFLEMFGAPDQSWSLGVVSDAINPAKGSIRTGPFGSQLLHSEFVDSGVAVLGIDNAVANEFRWSQRRFISPKKYQQLKRYTVRPGDVLITIMGTCGRCAIVPSDIPLAINTKHLCCITLDSKKCLPEYLHAYFLYHPDSLSYLGQTTKGAIMGGLNMEIIKSLPLRFPPVELQRQFVKGVKALHRVKGVHQSALTELDALFASLQGHAFGPIPQQHGPRLASGTSNR